MAIGPTRETLSHIQVPEVLSVGANAESIAEAMNNIKISKKHTQSKHTPHSGWQAAFLPDTGDESAGLCNSKGSAHIYARAMLRLSECLSVIVDDAAMLPDYVSGCWRRANFALDAQLVF